MESEAPGACLSLVVLVRQAKAHGVAFCAQAQAGTALPEATSTACWAVLWPDPCRQHQLVWEVQATCAPRSAVRSRHPNLSAGFHAACHCTSLPEVVCVAYIRTWSALLSDDQWHAQHATHLDAGRYLAQCSARRDLRRQACPAALIPVSPRVGSVTAFRACPAPPRRSLPTWLCQGGSTPTPLHRPHLDLREPLQVGHGLGIARAFTADTAGFLKTTALRRACCTVAFDAAAAATDRPRTRAVLTSIMSPAYSFSIAGTSIMATGA